MRRILGILAIFWPLAIVGQTEATLLTIGTGDYNGSTYNLIYDEDSPMGPIVWLDYSEWSGSGHWANRVAWANSLDTSLTNIKLNTDYSSINWNGSWRLPSTVDGPSIWDVGGNGNTGYNITNSEFGHLYYTELANKGVYDNNGSYPQLGWGLKNHGPFMNLYNYYYWSGTEYGTDASKAWHFAMYDGRQDPYWGKNDYGLWGIAVHSGQVEFDDIPEPVPEPSTFLLLGAGIVGIVVSALITRKKAC